MFKAIKDNKIIAISETPIVGGLNYDESIESEESLDDYIQFSGEYILKNSEEAIDVLSELVRQIRDSYLKETDIYMLEDYPVTNRQQVIDYRKYLRDYTEQENWYKNNPVTFKQWCEENPVVEE